MYPPEHVLRILQVVDEAARDGRRAVRQLQSAQRLAVLGDQHPLLAAQVHVDDAAAAGLAAVRIAIPVCIATLLPCVVVPSRQERRLSCLQRRSNLRLNHPVEGAHCARQLFGEAW